MPTKRGNWVVLALVVIGLAGATVAVGYRNLRVRLTKQQQQTQADPQRDLADAAERLMTLQEQYLQAGDNADLPAIRAAVQAIIDDYPDVAPAYTLLAQVNLDAKNYDAARDNLSRSLERDADQPEVHLLVADLAMMDGDLDAAESHITRAIKLKPGEGRYRLRLANVHFQRKQLDAARDAYLEALRLDSSLHQAHSGLADIYAAQNQLNLAIEQVQKAIDQTPPGRRDILDTYLRKKATLLRRDNQPQAALMTLESLSDKARLDPDAIEQFAVTWAQLGKPAHGATLYEEALRINPVHWRYAAGAARWHIKAGNPEQAQRHLRLLRRLDPNLPVIAELEKQLAQPQQAPEAIPQ